MGIDISPACMSLGDVLKFGSENMYPGMRKIRQATGMVKVQVGHHNVTYVCRTVAQPLYLIESCLMDIAGLTHHRHEKTHQSSGMQVIADAEPRINQYRPNVRFDQQAGYTTFHNWKIGANGAAIQNSNGHFIDGLKI